MKLQRIQALIGKAMAEHTDAQIWWLSLDEHYKVYIGGMFLCMIDNTKPRWIPRRLWNYLHRDYLKGVE